MATRDLYFTPYGTNATRHYWANSDSIDGWRAHFLALEDPSTANDYDAYDDTWGDTSLWQGRRYLGYYWENDVEINVYTGAAYGCMQNFVECDSAGNILGTSIADKLAGKVELITAASMRLSRYSDGYGTQNVRLRRATIGAIPNAGSHTDTSYSDAGDGLPAQDSIGQNATKWCFSGDLTSMLNIIQWLMDGNVACLHYGMSEVSHYYGTNGGASKRPILKVTLTITAPSPTEPGLATVADAVDGVIAPEWTTSTDEFEAFTDAELSYEIQYAADGSTYDEENTIETDPGALTETINFYDLLGLSAGQYYYAPTAKLRIRAVTPLWPEEGEQDTYESDWVESNAFAVDLRVTPSGPTSFEADNYAPYETETVTFTIGKPDECNALNSDGDPMGLTYTVELAGGVVLATSTGATADDEEVEITQAIGNLAAITASGEDITDETLYVRITPEEGTAAVYETAQTITIHRFRAPHITPLGAPARVEDQAVVYFRVTDTGYATTGQANTQMGTTMNYNIGGDDLTATVTWDDGLDGHFTVDNDENWLNPDLAYDIAFCLANAAPNEDIDPLASNEAEETIESYTPILVKRVKKSVTPPEAARSIAANAAVFHSNLNTQVDEGCVVVEKDLIVESLVAVAGRLLTVDENGKMCAGVYTPKKTLWTGSWSSGNITVPGIHNYSIFQIMMEGQATVVLASIYETGGTCYLRGFGGYYKSSTVLGGYEFSSTVPPNTDVLTWVGCHQIDHTASGSHGVATNRTVVKIVGII